MTDSVFTHTLHRETPMATVFEDERVIAGRREPPPGGRRATRLAAVLVLVAGLQACGEAPPAGWSGYVEGDYVHV